MLLHSHYISVLQVQRKIRDYYIEFMGVPVKIFPVTDSESDKYGEYLTFGDGEAY